MTQDEESAELKRKAAIRAADVLFPARRDFRAHPEGSWQDGIWQPSEDENADHYTFLLTHPGRKYPRGYERGARRKTHIDNLIGNNPDFLIREAAKLPEFAQRYAEYCVAAQALRSR